MKEVEIVGFTSKDGQPETLCGYRCVGTDAVLQELFLSEVRSAFVAIGGSRHRKTCLDSLGAHGFSLINAISESASMSSGGEGLSLSRKQCGPKYHHRVVDDHCAGAAVVERPAGSHGCGGRPSDCERGKPD